MLEYLVHRVGGHMYTKPGGRQADQYLVQIFTGAEGSIDSYTALFLCILYLKGLNRLIFFFTNYLYGITTTAVVLVLNLLQAGFRFKSEFSRGRQLQGLTWC